MMDSLANIASMLTALVALCAWGWFQWDAWNKMKKLENYLRVEKDESKKLTDDKGQRSLLHLMANVGLTDSEVLRASFRSRFIKRTTRGSENTPLASAILFEYDPTGTSN